MSRRKCCCGPCKVCRSGTGSATYQATISDITQVNTPPSEPSPPCACTSLNVTLPLAPVSYDQPLPAFITDAKPGGRNCRYGTASSVCDASPLNGVRAEAIKYQNNSGGTSCYGMIEIGESAGLILGGNVGTFEGTAVIDASHDRVNCLTLDVTVPVTKTSDFGGFGGTVWCGGTTLNLRMETV